MKQNALKQPLVFRKNQNKCINVIPQLNKIFKKFCLITGQYKCVILGQNDKSNAYLKSIIPLLSTYTILFK